MKKVLLIGDSISMDYGQYLPDFLAKGIHVYGKPDHGEAYRDLDIPLGGNGGDSAMVLEYLQNADDQVLSCDYFFFNCGLHDIKHNRASQQIQVSPAAYRENLEQILALMAARSIPVVFINSTPTDGSRHGKMKSFFRVTEELPAYNEIAEAVMAAHQIPVIDLYGFTQALGLSGDQLFRDHTHFVPEVIRRQAAYIAEHINGYVQ